MVGTYERCGRAGIVVPDNERLLMEVYIPAEDTREAKEGQKVVAAITGYCKGKSPRGRITEILGNAGDAGVDVLSIARSSGLPMEFPERVIRQAERTPEQVQGRRFSGKAGSS